MRPLLVHAYHHIRRVFRKSIERLLLGAMQQEEVAAWVKDLHVFGVHEIIKRLNNRTPHRFTGIYRYDGAVLRNEYLYDRFNPSVKHGDDIPMKDAYCSVVKIIGTIESWNAPHEPCLHDIKSPVVSYCGVLIRNEVGEPFGTLCHYDFLPCEQRISDRQFLEALAQMFYPWMNKDLKDII